MASHLYTGSIYNYQYLAVRKSDMCKRENPKLQVRLGHVGVGLTKIYPVTKVT